MTLINDFEPVYIVPPDMEYAKILRMQDCVKKNCVMCKLKLRRSKYCVLSHVCQGKICGRFKDVQIGKV